MLSEVEIRKMIPNILLKLGGMATKKQICDYISDNCELDDVEDLAKSKTRNEPKFVQRVGNIVCHANKKGVPLVAMDGFELAKISESNGKITWKFVLPSNTPYQDSLFSEDELVSSFEEKDKKDKRKVAETKVARKTDWDKVDELRKEVGIAGERFVYEKELEFVRTHFPNKINEVVWVSQTDGDELGYDIRSVCHTNPNKPLLIEVKSTTQPSLDTAFAMTRNEFELFRTNDDSKCEVELHRNYDRNKNGFKRKIYKREEVLNEFHAIVSVYTLRHRRTEM